MSKLLVGSATDVGLVRANNQDQMLVAPGLYAVADGMGGHAAGEVASSTAIRALQAAFEAGQQRSAEALGSAAKAANRAVWEQARSNRGMFGMGTTLVALAVVERHDGSSGLAAAHIGDSRLYLYRDGSLRQLTVDHSLVQELVDDGQISPAEAAIHPQRHVLTRALGVEPSVQVDLIDLVPHHGDRYLICSDGLPREASDDQIASVLDRFADPTEAAKELVALAKSRGGSDNITVVVVDVLANDNSPDTLIVVPGPASSALMPPVDGSREKVSGKANIAAPVPPGAHRAGPQPAHALQGLPGPSPAAPPGDGAELEAGLAARPEPAVTGPGGGPPGHLAAARPITWRVVGFLAAFCLVVGGAVACLAWYARSAYFVTISHGDITVFQGRPGGVLWFGPTVAWRTSYTKASVPGYYLPALQAGQVEPSLGQARFYVDNMVSEQREAEATTPGVARGAPKRKQRRRPAAGSKPTPPSATVKTTVARPRTRPRRLPTAVRTSTPR